MKKPKKPKRGKAPKRPKQSASITAWENFDRRYKEWEKRERQKVADYNKKLSQLANGKKKKESLVAKYSHKKPLSLLYKVA